MKKLDLFRRIFAGVCGVLTLILLFYFLFYDRGSLVFVMIPALVGMVVVRFGKHSK